MPVMRKILLSLLAFMPLVAYAQSASEKVATAKVAPDDDDILARTIDSGSPFHYPSLMMRYNAGDTTLTHEDYRYLYYGYAFTDNYRPLAGIPAEDMILEVFAACAEGEEPDYNGMMEIIEHANKVMKSDPFSPKNLNFLVYAYGATGDTLNERINYDRMAKVIAAIESSGTGESEKSPMHVLKLSHAADLLTARGLTIAKRTVVSKTQEFIMLDKRDGKNSGYYFDYSRVFRNKPEEAPKSDKKKWMLNNWPIN